MAQVKVNKSNAVVLTLSQDEAGYVLDLLAAANEPRAEALFNALWNGGESAKESAAA